MMATLSVTEGLNPPNKRLRQGSTSTGQIPDLNLLPSDPGSNKYDVHNIISSFLSLPDLHSLSSSLSIGDSFDEALDKVFEASNDDESYQDRLIDRGFQLASLLRESTKRCSRKRVTLHNSKSWPLPLELTIKVFTMLDTKSLVKASACCTMFKKCAVNCQCYSQIDLTTGNVNNNVVRSMILNAGEELRSLKVGNPKHLLTGSCLVPLSHGHIHGFVGNLLRSLHIYNHGRWLDNESLCGVLSVCSNLTDVKIVGVNNYSLSKIFYLLTKECQHLFLEKENDVKEKQKAWVRSIFYSGWSFEGICPNITSLSLIGFDLSDKTAYLLIKGLRKLKHLNLSKSSIIHGRFLSDVITRDCKDSLLESLILQDCFYLEKRYICQFMISLLLTEYFRFIRRIDLSSTRQLVCDRKSLHVEKLKEIRPDLTIVADFRHAGSSSSLSSGDTSSSGSN